MNTQPFEESSSSSDERRETGGVLPSQELLDVLMEGPRKWSHFFNTIVSSSPEASGFTDKEVSDELDAYPAWLEEHIKSTNNEYQSLVLSSPHNLPQRSELSFHIINQFIMPQWHRAVVSPTYPKMDAVDLETAQILLAMESTKILTSRTKHEGPQDLFNNELRDFDTMINLLQMSIDGEYRNQPNVIAVPHPEIGSESHQADFLIFEPKDDGTFSKKEVQSANILDPSLAPGAVAVDLLQKLRISTLSRRPEFQDQKVFHRLILSRETAKAFNPEQ